MALKNDKKKKYEGPRTAWDTANISTEWDKKQAAALKNAQGKRSNAIVALEDQEFRKHCEDAGVKPTARQASKFRQPAPHGAAARVAGINVRLDPRKAR